MAAKYWVGTAGGGWNTTSNWSPASLPSATDDIIFNSSNNNSSIINGSYTINSIDFNGYTGNLNVSNGSLTLTIGGSNDGTATGISLRLSSVMTITLTPQFIFTSSIGGYIYCNGKSLLNATTFNNATGVWTTQDALNTSANITITIGTLIAGASITTSGAFTLTAGTLTLNSYTHSFNTFIANAVNTRTIDFGTSTLNITGNSATVWTVSPTNLTTLGTNLIANFTYSGSTGTRTIIAGVQTEVNSIMFNITAGSDIVTFGNANWKGFNFTGFSGTSNIGTGNTYGSITLSPTQTIPAFSQLNLVGTSTTQTITSNGVTIPVATMTINSATTTVQTVGALTTTGTLTLTAGTFNINGNLTIGSASTLTLTAGTMTANNGANITCGIFSSSNSNTRTLNMGSGTWTLTSAATVWSLATSTGMTLNAQQSRIVINNTSSPTTICTFSGGGLTYYTVEYARGAATANFNVVGSNTYVNFIDNTSTVAHTISWASSNTQTFYKFNVRGSAGARITFISSGGAAATLVKVGQGIVCYCDYLTVSANASCSPASGVWYAGANSTGSGGNWTVTNAPSSQSLLGAGGVG